jgi:GT2 family glycosyltransferase
MVGKLWLNETVEPEIGGWAYAVEDATASERLRVVVTAGAAILGQQRRTVTRPDVDVIFPDDTGPKGFILPIDGVAALAGVVNATVDEPSWLSVACGRARRNWHGMPIALRDPSRRRTLASEDAGSGLKIADLWFSTSHEITLRLTLAKDAEHALVVRAHQLMAQSGLPLSLAYEVNLRPGEQTIMPVPLANPFMPLLVTAVDADDQLVASDCLAFPSIFRGGAHHGEALAACDGSLAGLARYGDDLLQNLCGLGAEAAPFLISDVQVDLRGATGAERIFAPTCLEWLNRFLGVGIVPAAPDVADYPADRLAGLSDRRRPAAGAVALPAAAVPTLCVLSGRHDPRRGLSGKYEAPFILSEANTKRSAWLTWMPPLGGWFADAQPHGIVPKTVQVILPGLTESEMALPVDEAGREGLAMPAATISLDPQPGRGTRLMFPVAVDEPEEPAGPAVEHDRISVVVPVRAQTRRLVLLIESLAGQTLRPRIELVIVDGGLPRAVARPLRDALAQSFEGAHHFIETDQLLSPATLINRGAAHATGGLLLIAASDIVLHDPRTLARLATLAEMPQIGSASCMLLYQSASQADPMFHSAGYFLDRYDFLKDGLVLAEPDWGPLPPGLWPVAANSLDLLMIRRGLWEQVGGLDAANHPDGGGDVQLALRLADLGLVQVCSTAVSAVCERRRSRARQTLFRARPAVDAERLRTLQRSAAGLRRLS